MKFVVATGNEGKLKEFRHILKDIAEVVSAKELGIGKSGTVDFPPEDGDTYEANALIKAHFVSQQVNLPAIADDSGLEVDALDGEPGLYSARYGNKNSDAERREYMLEQLQHAPQPRKARFCSSIAFTLPDKQAFTFFATTEGEITTEARGNGGFGYDPIFLSDDLGITFSEASQDDKKRVSHRGRALEKFLAWLESPEAKQVFLDNKL